MAIVAADILTRFATTAGAAGDTTAGAAATSLGKYVSTTSWANAATLFDDVSGTENAASEAEYRCIFVLNNHATLTAQDVRVYISAETAGGAAIALGVDPTAASAKGAAPAQALTIANEDTAPAGVAFSSPTDYAGGVQLGNLGPGQVRAVWIRRTTANTAPIDADGFTLAIGCDTAA